jgi:TRAP-type C4-dicarboxylate transport system permease small subunit
LRVRGEHPEMKFRIVLDKISLVLAAIACVAIGIMMILMVGDAISRKIIGSIPGGYNTTIALLTILVFFPMGYVQIKKAHIVVDLVTTRLDKKTQAILRIITSILAVLVFAVLTWACGQKAWESTLAKEEWMGLVYYPAWPFRWTLPLGMGIFSLQMIFTSMDEIKAFIGRA